MGVCVTITLRLGGACLTERRRASDFTPLARFACFKSSWKQRPKMNDIVGKFDAAVSST
jgi:hypothetical protein